MASFYRPPGVYPEIINSPELVQLSQTARIPVIIGRGQTSITITSERVTHLADAYGPDVLSSEISNIGTLLVPDYEILSVGAYPGVSTWFEGIHFNIVDVAGVFKGISWIIGAPAPATPNDGEYYYITYKTPVTDSQYEYKLYTDANQLIAVHGEETIANEVSIAGVLALRNGALGVGVIQLNISPRTPGAPTPAEYYVAYQATLPILEQLDTPYCRYIVPCTCISDGTDLTDPDIFGLFYTHVNNMSSSFNRRWSMLIRGIRANTTVNSNTDVKNDLIALGSGYNGLQGARRVIIVAPGEVYRVLLNTTTNTYQSTLVGGWALAAAAAGRICGYDNPAIPLTWKAIAGLTTDRIFSAADMNAIADLGNTSLFMYKGTNIICRHGMTTDHTNANTQEISVVEIEDYIKVQSIYVLEDSYIGSIITVGLTQAIRGSLSAFMEQLIRKQVIADYDSGSISVSQDSNDPRVINIFFRVKPSYPLNWIDIKFQFYAGNSSV